ncbi:hydrolase [Streptomyces sp. JJ66]|uniref:hydrolase n=1 Tax=Streptomyces sp. JJ66 TaxID=2803843 RepID=UPI001C592C5C|nr:hydrolase [Streptomyces sp. JJ66]MBW1602473.1 hydrolase [Streptomyces sp. JJ66]
MLTQTPPDTGLETAADEVRQLAAHRAPEADRSGALDPEVVRAVRRAGFGRHFVARHLGGAEGTFAALTRAVSTVGEGCAATAWCASLAAYSSRFASLLPPQGHEELWGRDPDTLVATGLVPSGRAEASGDDWSLSGSWGYVSGIDDADWALVCAPVADPASGTAPAAGPPETRFFALPRGSYQVTPTWDATGMRATGSHTLTVQDARVPAHLSFSRRAMLSGHNAHSTVPAHNVPFQAVGGLTFIAPALGAAVGCLAAGAAALGARRRTQAAELALVRASGRIDAARHLVAQNAEVIDDRHFTPELMARNERNATFAAELLQEAVGLVVRASGTGGLAQGRPVERFWRDVTTATSHIALQYDTAARKNYSAVLAGPES